MRLLKIVLVSISLLIPVQGWMSDHHSLNEIASKVQHVIENFEEVSGLKTEEFSALRSEILKMWKVLVKHGFIDVICKDQEIRPYFVAIQGIVEHVLSNSLQKEVVSLKGIIHTPMPATPLCTQGEISKDLVDLSIEKDSKRLFTVKLRTTILRDYLRKEGDLYVAYPKDGLEKRTLAQQKVYREELANYPKHLFNMPLECAVIPEKLIGATYLFTDQAGNISVFAIRMTQAKDPKELGNFGLWFGSIDNQAIHNRVQEVLNFIKQTKGTFSPFNEVFDHLAQIYQD